MEEREIGGNKKKKRGEERWRDILGNGKCEVSIVRYSSASSRFLNRPSA